MAISRPYGSRRQPTTSSPASSSRRPPGQAPRPPRSPRHAEGLTSHLPHCTRCPRGGSPTGRHRAEDRHQPAHLEHGPSAATASAPSCATQSELDAAEQHQRTLARNDRTAARRACPLGQLRSAIAAALQQVEGRTAQHPRRPRSAPAPTWLPGPRHGRGCSPARSAARSGRTRARTAPSRGCSSPRTPRPSSARSPRQCWSAHCAATPPDRPPPPSLPAPRSWSCNRHPPPLHRRGPHPRIAVTLCRAPSRPTIRRTTLARALGPP
jgi:hypothetical protein